MKREKTENKTVRKGSVECPELLAQYIELTNLLSQELKLLTPQQLNPGMEKRLLNAGVRKRTSLLTTLHSWMNEVEEYYESFPRQIRLFLFQGRPKKPRSIQQARAMVEFFHGRPDERGALQLLSNFGEVEPLLLEVFLNWTLGNRIKDLKAVSFFLHNFVRFSEGKGVTKFFNQRGSLSLGLSFPVSVDISPGGFLQIADDNILQMLIREKVEVARIKRCPVCSNIFWASRSNRKACSEKCVATHRQRNYRQRDKKAESEKKRENRQYQKIRGAGAVKRRR